MKSEVKSQSAPKQAGPYSQAVKSCMVYCSGQIGTDPQTGLLEDGVRAQTSRALSNLEAVLHEAGLELDSVVKTTVFLADMADFQAMNEEYAKRFSPPYPARSTVQAAALPRGARVEIDAIASV